MIQENIWPIYINIINNTNKGTAKSIVYDMWNIFFQYLGILGSHYPKLIFLKSLIFQKHINLAFTK